MAPARNDSRVLLYSLLTTILFGITGFVLTGLVSPSLTYVQIPLHAVIEATCGFSSLILGGLLLLLQRAGQMPPICVFPASGLLAMGIIDVAHSLPGPGSLFVWLRVAASFMGGLGFTALWLPRRLAEHRLAARLPLAFTAVALALSIGLFLLRARLPEAVLGGGFTGITLAVNVATCLLFLASTIRVITLPERLTIFDRAYLGGFCFLQLSSGLFFGYSALWTATWWWWHVLRLLATTLGVGYVVYRHLDLQRQLREAIRARDDLISLAAHELKTPLTSLSLEVDLLYRTLEAAVSETGLRATVSSSFTRVRSRMRRFTALVNDLLQSSRITAGTLTLQCRHADLSRLAEAAIQNLGIECAERGCQIVARIEPGLSGWIDPSLIEILFTNLLANAIKFGAGKPVEVELRRSENTAIVTVSDRGLGIAETDRERIFGKFERVYPVTEYPGMGLGLYIVREIVRLHRGKIGVQSMLGQGATFTVVLPLDNLSSR